MIRKITGVIIAAAMLVMLMPQSISTLAADNDRQGIKAEIAENLIDAIGIYNAMPEDKNETAQTGAFVQVVMGIIGYAPSSEEDAVEMAKQMYLLTDRSAMAGDKLTYIRALQICLSAAGYNAKMAMDGFEESAVRALGGSTDISDGLMFANDDALTCLDAYVMLYNTLEADIMTSDYSGNYTVEEGVTILGKRYNIYRTEGILTAAGTVDLYGDGGVYNKDRVRIGMSVYVYEGSGGSELIGRNVEAYIDADDNTVCYMYAYDNAEKVISREDVLAAEEDSLEYSENGKRAEVRLEPAYDVIYNGAVYKGADWQETAGAGAVLRFVDNDSDGRYELLIISDYKYMKVSAIDPVNGIIYGSGGVTLDLSDDSADREITDSETGSAVSINGIGKGDLLMVQSSLDGVYLRAEICSVSLVGRVTSVSEADHKIGIDGTEYTMDAAFGDNTGFMPETGKSYTFWVGANDKIVYAENGISSMRYGYIIRTWLNEGGDELTARLLDEAGDVKDLVLAERVNLDGGTRDSISLDTSVFGSGGCLIRYSTDGNGKITGIDTAVSGGGYVDGDTAADANCLTRYDYSDELIYKSSTSMFGDEFCISSAVVFMVPADGTISDKSYYNVVTSSVFRNDSKYNSSSVEVYNIDKFRNVEAVVYKNTTNVRELYSTESKSAVVDSVALGVNEYNENVYNITYFMDNRFYETQLPEELAEEKQGGGVVAPGDVIRFSEQDGVIKSIIIDFDADVNTMSSNPQSEAGFNLSESRILQYQYGMIGENDGRNMLLAQPDVRDASDPDDFEWNSMRLVAAPTSNIVLVSRICDKNANGTMNVVATEIRRIEPYEILTYENSGEKTDFALIRQRYLEPSQMIIYRTTLR